MASSLATTMLFLLPLHVLAVSAANTIQVSFSASPPSSAVGVPADFVGLGFESAFLDDYSNAFSANLVNSLASHLSISPTIRIGGTSGDRLIYNPNQQQSTVCVPGQKTGLCPYSSSAVFSVGPSYFNGFKAFPNSHMTIQAPMGRNINISNTVAVVKNAYAALGANRTAAIALGNEVNFYEPTPQDYVQAAHTVQQAVVNALGLSGSGQKIFEVLDLASSATSTQADLTVQNAFANGLDNNGLTLLAAEHWYQISGAGNLQRDLMNHSAITHKFTNYGAALSYLQAHQTSVPLAFTETGAVLGSSPYAAVFGTALWAVDFNLYSMSQGIARVDGSQRPQAAHSLWNPIANVTDSNGPEVRAAWYAPIFVADFVGTTGQSRAVEATLNSDYYTAYGAYESGSLTRVALVNLLEWTGSGTRPSQTFSVPLPSGKTTVQAAVLDAAAGALAGGHDVDGEAITYAGQQWSYKLSNGKAYGTRTLVNVPVSQGVATVNVPASQAMLLYLS